jgi:hypothetical protein
MVDRDELIDAVEELRDQAIALHEPDAAAILAALARALRHGGAAALTEACLAAEEQSLRKHARLERGKGTRATLD